MMETQVKTIGVGIINGEWLKFKAAEFGPPVREKGVAALFILSSRSYKSLGPQGTEVGTPWP